jgi:hypothetical protein
VELVQATVVVTLGLQSREWPPYLIDNRTSYNVRSATTIGGAVDAMRCWPPPLILRHSSLPVRGMLDHHGRFRQAPSLLLTTSASTSGGAGGGVGQGSSVPNVLGDFDYLPPNSAAPYAWDTPVGGWVDG